MKIAWNNISTFKKILLASICPECQCQMLVYDLLIGWQKCGACGYTRQSPLENENGHEEFNLIPKSE